MRNAPTLVTQLNLFKDSEEIIRVRSKFRTWNMERNGKFPILLPRNSPLTNLIIIDRHLSSSHTGLYYVLNLLRKEFYIPRIFSTVKSAIKGCVSCKRFNSRPVHTNQSFYRDFRENPPRSVFKTVFLDHFGPYHVVIQDSKVKVWILCVCCLWSRAINLIVCYDMTTAEFLRAFQMHVHQYGLCELILSDMGSQIVAGGNVISDLLKDPDAKKFLDENHLKTLTFIQYSKGKHELEFTRRILR